MQASSQFLQPVHFFAIDDFLPHAATPQSLKFFPNYRLHHVRGFDRVGFDEQSAASQVWQIFCEYFGDQRRTGHRRCLGQMKGQTQCQTEATICQRLFFEPLGVR